MYEKKKKILEKKRPQIKPVYYSLDTYEMYIMHCYDQYGIEISCGLCSRYNNDCKYEKNKKQAIALLSRK